MAGAFSSAFSNAYDIGTASAVAVTTAGGPVVRISRATQWYRKTLSELREEERERLEKLRKQSERKVAKALKAGETDEGLLLRFAREPLRKAEPNLDWLTVPMVDEIAQMIVAALLAARWADEDDAEAMLLLAA